MIVTYSIGDICGNELHSLHILSGTFVVVTYSIGDICGNEPHPSHVLSGTFVETHRICHVFYLSWTFVIVTYSIGDICGHRSHSSHVLYQGPTWQHSSIISYFLSRRFRRLPRLRPFVQPRSFPRKCRVGVFSPLRGNNGVQTTFISSPRHRSHVTGVM